MKAHFCFLIYYFALLKMALILHIDTALQTGSVCLGRDGRSIAYKENAEQGQQAVWLHSAIKQIMNDCNLQLSDLDAIAVSNGPGSYTGLRIGLSAAKGICYTLNIPLICVNTLQVMAAAVAHEAEDLICPMIDARRMEVYTAIYDKHLNIVEKPHALVLQENSFYEILQRRKVLFTGDGVLKFKNLTTFSKLICNNNRFNAFHLLSLSLQMYQRSQFADLAYTEPEYIKPVYTT